MEKKYNRWGGKREGAGRPKNTGEKPLTKKQKRKCIGLRLDEENYEKLVRMAKEHGISQSDMVNLLIRTTKKHNFER